MRNDFATDSMKSSGTSSEKEFDLCTLVILDQKLMIGTRTCVKKTTSVQLTVVKAARSKHKSVGKDFTSAAIPCGNRMYSGGGSVEHEWAVQE